MNIIYLDTCKSTNLEAKKQLENGFYIGPGVIVSRKQTQGKGRSGNWFSPEDCGIYMSVICEGKNPQEYNLGLLVCHYAEQVLQVLERQFQLLLTRNDCSNDILLAERKLAGILCEYHPASDKLIVGIGINTFRPTKIRKDLVNKITYLNDWAAEHLIIHDKLVQMIAEEIIKI